MAGRDLTLTPRNEAVRDKQPTVSVVEFDLAQIKERFDKNNVRKRGNQKRESINYNNC